MARKAGGYLLGVMRNSKALALWAFDSEARSAFLIVKPGAWGLMRPGVGLGVRSRVIQVRPHNHAAQSCELPVTVVGRKLPAELEERIEAAGYSDAAQAPLFLDLRRWSVRD